MNTSERRRTNRRKSPEDRKLGYSNQKMDFVIHSMVGVVLAAVKRNGIEKTLEDLHKNCRLGPRGDELVYRGMLSILDKMSHNYELIEEHKKKHF